MINLSVARYWKSIDRRLAGGEEERYAVGNNAANKMCISTFAFLVHMNPQPSGGFFSILLFHIFSFFHLIFTFLLLSRLSYRFVMVYCNFTQRFIFFLTLYTPEYAALKNALIIFFTWINNLFLRENEKNFIEKCL